MLASGSHDHTIKLWNVSAGKAARTLTGHSDRVWSVAFSPDGKMLASGAWDRTVRLWDVSARPYQGMNITGVTGLTESTIVSLKSLGAVAPLAPGIGSVRACGDVR